MNISLARSVLHEIKNEQLGDVLLAGVFDGHAGTAASETASGILPALFTSELSTSSDSIQVALENSWEVTCDTYRSGCDENGECVADYDPLNGILFAETGSADVVGKFHELSSYPIVSTKTASLNRLAIEM